MTDKNDMDFDKIYNPNDIDALLQESVENVITNCTRTIYDEIRFIDLMNQIISSHPKLQSVMGEELLGGMTFSMILKELTEKVRRVDRVITVLKRYGEELPTEK